MEFDKSGNLAFISKVLEKLKGKWIAAISSSVILAFLVYAVTDLLNLNPLIGVPLIGFAYLGEIAFMRKLINNEGDRLEDIFMYYKHFITAALTTALFFILLTVGLALIIIPGILFLVSYSFAFYILQENPQIGTLEAFRQSKELTKGYRTKIGFFYLIFFLISVVVFAISLALSLIPNLIWGTNLLLYAGIIAGILSVVFILPVFYASVTAFYDNLKNGGFVKTEEQLEIGEENVLEQE